ncbi:hypothetical protein AB0C76_32875 [Kitasatospora sp. NPDC048722]|uniref:hypothetical protein n=1 Tax=Kitasatospora sp. NPDC048722 TaxID=3155639 RepID=UPI0033C1E28E
MVPVQKRCPAGCTAASRADSVLRQQARAAAPTIEQPAAPVPAPARQEPAPRREPAKAPARRPVTKTTRPTRTAPAKTAAAVAVDVVDGEWTVDTDMPAPTGKLTWDALLAWIGAGLPMLGVDRLHRDGTDADGTVCLTAAAAAALKIPAKLPATAAALARFDAKVRKAATAANLELSATIGAGFKVYRRRTAGRHVSVKLLIVPWLGQGDKSAQKAGELVTALSLGPDDTPNGLTLAHRLRSFVGDLGVAPGATAAVTSMHLIDALRPRTTRVQGEDGKPRSVPREGALPSGDLAVPPAAGARHPLTLAERRAGNPVCEEEDFHAWARPLTAAERAMPWAVAVDVCASFLSVTETLRLAVGPLEPVESPAWSTATAGIWLCDFTDIQVDDDLPHPATFHGLPPTGPGWYATPTVAYMAAEYGFDPATITRAYLSTHSVAILKDWTARIRGGYKRCYAVLGIVDGMSDEDFLAAYETLKADAATNPAKADALVLLAAYKAVYKGGIGKWSGNASYIHDDDQWAEQVAAAWTYRPENRFAIHSAARTGAHRRMRKTKKLTGRTPIAINVDSYLYATAAPSPRELLPKTDDGKPVPGALRLGAAPGSFKHESSVPMEAVAAAMDEQLHPSRLTHDYDTAGNPLTETEES